MEKNKADINSGLIELITKEATNRLKYIAAGNTTWSDKNEKEIIEELNILNLYYKLDTITVTTPYGEFSPTAQIVSNVGLSLNFKDPGAFVEALENQFFKVIADVVGDLDESSCAETRTAALLHYIIYLINDDAKWSDDKLQEKLIKELKCIDYMDASLLKVVTVEIIPKGRLSLAFLSQGAPVQMEKFWPTPKDFREAIIKAFNDFFSI